MSSFVEAEHDSRIDRVRAQVTKLMHMTRERNVAPAPAAAPGATSPPPSAVRPETAASDVYRLADSLRALQVAMEETDHLIRQGWDLAVDLNQIRRMCSGCEAADLLCEAIGSYQGLLNRWRHNEQAATRAIGSMRMLAEAVESVRDTHDAAAAIT